jgi:hypothetical protein
MYQHVLHRVGYALAGAGDDGTRGSHKHAVVALPRATMAITSIAVDGAGHVYLAIRDEQQVWRFDPHIRPAGAWHAIGYAVAAMAPPSTTASGAAAAPPERSAGAVAAVASNQEILDVPTFVVAVHSGRFIVILERCQSFTCYCVATRGLVPLRRVRLLDSLKFVAIACPTPPAPAFGSAASCILRVVGLCTDGSTALIELWPAIAELSAVVCVSSELTADLAVTVASYCVECDDERTMFPAADLASMTRELLSYVLFRLGVHQFRSYRSGNVQKIAAGVVDDDEEEYLAINGRRDIRHGTVWADYITAHDRRAMPLDERPVDESPDDYGDDLDLSGIAAMHPDSPT